MLKRLELIGFKSFADKTKFDFSPGITAIVGPNGSGKSNVVDAVRWILGEQSAKSLRGGEMADVIFNGSTSRKSLGMAEVIMTFDNARKVLATDAAEVQITRRVYRDGQGEYLINGQPCRLKDIKDLFLGSGAGTSAYSIIEQGRVDALLQASTLERRLIFEEAAGISRFKAKKIESLRKLEKVEQNLARVKDILAEVDKQLRTARLQASKAQRYQEYSARLQELRVGLGLQEFGELTQQLDRERAALEAYRSELGETLSQTTAWESEIAQLDQALARGETAIEARNAELTLVRQQIASLEATQQHERATSAELEKEHARLLIRRLELDQQLRTLFEQLKQAGQAADQAAQQTEQQRQVAEQWQDALAQVDAQLAELERQLLEDREAQPDRERLAGMRRNEVVSLSSQIDRLRGELERKQRKIEERRTELQANEEALTALGKSDADLQQRLADKRQQLADKQASREKLRTQAAALRQLLESLRMEQSGVRARLDLLEGLERSQEGLGTGVREVVALLQREHTELADGSWRWSDQIVGLVADLLTVPHEVAPLIDLALGDVAQRLVVRDVDRVAEHLTQRGLIFAGRVSFLPLWEMPQRPQPEAATDFDAFPTADTLISTLEPQWQGLARQLLGDTRIVPDLATARRLRALALQRGQRMRFVTQAGELLDADGTLTVGTHHAEMGILSRKSELRELRQSAAELHAKIQRTLAEADELKGRIERLDLPIQALEREIGLLTGEMGDLGSRISQLRQRQEWLRDEIALTDTEISGLQKELEHHQTAWQQAKVAAEQAEIAAGELQQRIDQLEQRIRDHKHERSLREQRHTAAQRNLAQMMERLQGLQTAYSKLHDDWRQRRADFERLTDERTQLQTRLDEIFGTLLQATTGLAELYREKETHEAALLDLVTCRDHNRQRRQQLYQNVQTLRAHWQERQHAAHQHELAVRDLEGRRSALVARLRDDYQIDLAELFRNRSSAPPSGDPAAVQEEITELRHKLSRLGSVNLDALRELAEIETRAHEMQSQYDDLTSARRSLVEIIDKINNDSRQLFMQTFEAVRTHFQELFRKLFAGGMADVILENPDDVLESGIEIQARPPGKELRSISLMSGGEKTLTAVALLLAIFRSKPSPFCLLDEVDAALDDGNTGRLAAVLREFLDQSQFILITHKKRMMAAADVLYGITMQESGVSKQVSVHFEDWQEPSRQAA